MGTRLAYNLDMARGWESKSVEAQQEEAVRTGSAKPAPSAAELEIEGKRRALELARRRALDDLRRATVPAHRHMLEQAIVSLDEQLAALLRRG